jgi:hypothetical protein
MGKRRILFQRRRSRQPSDNSRPRERGGFFSEERTKARREFRVEVSGNRKWIFIGLAVVVACGTAIYFSIAYGGGVSGVMSFVSKLKGFL